MQTGSTQYPTARGSALVHENRNRKSCKYGSKKTDASIHTGNDDRWVETKGGITKVPMLPFCTCSRLKLWTSKT